MLQVLMVNTIGFLSLQVSTIKILLLAGAYRQADPEMPMPMPMPMPMTLPMFQPQVATPPMMPLVNFDSQNSMNPPQV